MERHPEEYRRVEILPIWFTLLVIFFAAGASGGAAPGLPLKSSPSWFSQTVIIVEARTGQVLFCQGRNFPGEDALNLDALKGKLRDTLADLAELPKRR